MKAIRILAVLFTAAYLANVRVSAQTTAELSGRVTDTQNARIPKATLTIRNAATGVQTSTETTGSGDYSLSGLFPGTYSITAAAKGFNSETRDKVVLETAQRASLDFTLHPGTSSQTVTVTDAGILVNKDDAAVGATIRHDFVENIALNGRSLQSLFTLVPGVVLVSNQSLGPAGGQFSVNGQRSDSNIFMVDGMSANNGISANGMGADFQTGAGNLPAMNAVGGTQGMVTVDALEEFQIQTNTFSAEYGRSPGGQFMLTTRSGTNQYHGSAYEFLRNEALDANDWFSNANSIPRTALRQHQFGGTLGGPLSIPGFYDGRDRTFFFAAFEGLQLVQPAFVSSVVPGPALRTQIAAPLQPLINVFPQPNGVDEGNGFGRYSAVKSSQTTLWSGSLRLDHAFSSNLRAFVRYNRSPSQVLQPGLADNFKRFSSDLTSVTGSLTWSPTPTISNQLQLNTTSASALGGNTAIPGFNPTAFLPSGLQTYGFQVSLRIKQPRATYQVSNGLNQQQQFEVIDTASWQLGAHTLKIGLDERRLTPVFRGQSYFQIAEFTSIADLTSGYASAVLIQGYGAIGKPIFWNHSFFADDTWKLSKRVTLSFGVRWEINPPPGSANGVQPYVLNMFPNASNLASLALAPPGTPQYHTQWTNFAPRVGIAWQLDATPGWERVLRIGAGQYFDTGNGWSSIAYSTYPFQGQNFFRRIAYPPVDLNELVPPPLAKPTPPYGNLYPLDPNLKLPYTLQWSAAIEQSLGKNQSLTASYVGNGGRQLITQFFYIAGNVNPNFTTVAPVTNAASSSYNALQVKYQARPIHGVQAFVGYTWAHAMDNNSLDGQSTYLVRGNSDYDVRHSVNAAITYEIPTLPSSSRIARSLLSGWGVDLRITASSAFPIDIIGNTIVLPDGTVPALTPSLVPGVPLYLSNRAVPNGRQINPAAFYAPPDQTTNGTLGRNVVRGFATGQADVSIRRTFALSERWKLQFRGEAFNVTNHPNFGINIDNQLGDTTFGQAIGTLPGQLSGLNSLYQVGGPRSLQLAARFSF